jgi:hypothetical protein
MDEEGHNVLMSVRAWRRAAGLAVRTRYIVSFCWLDEMRVAGSTR